MEYIIKYKKIKNGYVRIDKDGKLVLSIPIYLKNNEKFKNSLLEKGEILLEKIKKKSILKACDGNYIYLFGEKVEKNHIITNTIKDENKFLDKYFKDILYEYSIPILDDYSMKIKKKYNGLTIKKLKSKRGSCSYDQKIILNQNLVHLPNKYIKYVIIHEVCHLKQKNHSHKFWELIEQFCPDYKNLRKEMRNIILK